MQYGGVVHHAQAQVDLSLVYYPGQRQDRSGHLNGLIRLRQENLQTPGGRQGLKKRGYQDLFLLLPKARLMIWLVSKQSI